MDENEKSKFLHILKESKRAALSRGLFGNTYLVEDGQYVVKTQRLLVEDLEKKTGKFWNELRIYEWVNTLPPDQQNMFCRLLAWETIQPCDLPARQTNYLSTARREEIRKLNATPVCVEMIMSNKGIPFQTWLTKHMPNSRRMVYSFLRQLVAIHLIMFESGGYFHNDLHFENVLVSKNKANKQMSYTWEGKTHTFRIADGIGLTAIDYGEATKRKPNKTSKRDARHLLEDVVESIADLLLKRYKYKHDTDVVVEEKQDDEGKKSITKKSFYSARGHTIIVFPTRVLKGIDRIIKEYPLVFEKAKEAMIGQDKAYENVFQRILEHKLVADEDVDHMERRAVRRIQQELQLMEPAVFGKLFGGVEFRKSTLLSVKSTRAFLDCTSVSEVLELLK